MKRRRFLQGILAALLPRMRTLYRLPAGLFARHEANHARRLATYEKLVGK